ncbi:hypothetical protein [Neorhodopirellula lusitana]|uniref:hypothetical protein n=1 Tax=Neorhodopirellula lusitana TaxID=445327 RepID=UPI0024B708E7|nr:hypothetical protein [Neorhodopirellula lusitana]
MTTVLKKTCQTITVCTLPLVMAALISGCGRSDQAQVIGGIGSDFLLELKAGQQEYSQQVDKKNRQTSHRRHPIR